MPLETSEASGAPRPDDRASDLAAGTLLAGRYRIERLLGRGGMGAVYEATHVQLGRSVALKVLKRELSENGEAVARFMQEARIAAAIGHVGIVDVFDLGVAEAGVFLAMEKLVGVELADRIESGVPMSERECTSIAIDVAGAIDAAHEHGVVHRDLKPQNVFLARPRGATKDVVKVLDFGVAKLTRLDGQNLTQTGMIYGTPMYMPPEQLRGARDVDGRADVYALGCILYEMLTAHRPFEAGSLPELVLRIVTELPRRVCSIRPEVTAPMERIVARAMAPKLAERYPTMRALREALIEHDAFLATRSPAPAGSAAAQIGTDATVAGQSTPQSLRVMGSLPEALPSITSPSATSPSSSTPSPSTSLLPDAPAPRGSQPVETPHATKVPDLVSPGLSGESEPLAAPPSRGPAIVAGIALTLLAVIGGGYFVARDAPPVTNVASEPVTTIAPPSTSGTGAGMASVDPPEPERRTVAFTSDPLGVQIVLGDDTCTAPCTFELERTVTDIVARYPGRPEVHIPVAWPPQAAMHVAVPAAEPSPSPSGRALRRGPGTGRPTTPPRGDPPPLLVPR